jgi:hypothetical protein
MAELPVIAVEVGVVIVGALIPVPATATFCVVAPVLALVTFPLLIPGLWGENLTYIVVVDTRPAIGVKLTLAAKPEPELSET